MNRLITLVLLASGCEKAVPVRAVQPASAPASRPAAGPPTQLTATFAASPIKTEGEPDEPVWNSAARTGSFLDTKTRLLVRPYSDSRLLSDNDNLYLLLYAADENVQVPKKRLSDQLLGSFDHFDIQIRRAAAPETTYHLQIAPDGSLYDARVTAGKEDPSWSSGIKKGFDLDGTVNNTADEDEEWVVESALPLNRIGAKPGETLLVSIARCDTPKDGVHSCGQWGLDVASGAPVGVVQLSAAK